MESCSKELKTFCVFGKCLQRSWVKLKPKVQSAQAWNKKVLTGILALKAIFSGSHRQFSKNEEAVKLTGVFPKGSLAMQ